MPIEELRLQVNLPKFIEESEQVNNAYKALFAALSSCANVTKELSEIKWPNSRSFGYLLNSMHGYRQRGTDPIFLKCLNYLDLAGCILDRHDLSRSNCEGARFYRSSLDDVCFEKARLSSTNFIQAKLIGANFCEAKLDASNLLEAYLDGASFVNSSLSGANLEQVNFSGVRLDNANFSWSNLDGQHSGQI